MKDSSGCQWYATATAQRSPSASALCSGTKCAVKQRFENNRGKTIAEPRQSLHVSHFQRQLQWRAYGWGWHNKLLGTILTWEFLDCWVEITGQNVTLESFFVARGRQFHNNPLANVAEHNCDFRWTKKTHSPQKWNIFAWFSFVISESNSEEGKKQRKKRERNLHLSARSAWKTQHD